MKRKLLSFVLAASALLAPFSGQAQGIPPGSIPKPTELQKKLPISVVKVVWFHRNTWTFKVILKDEKSQTVLGERYGKGQKELSAELVSPLNKSPSSTSSTSTSGNTSPPTLVLESDEPLCGPESPCAGDINGKVSEIDPTGDDRLERLTKAILEFSNLTAQPLKQKLPVPGSAPKPAANTP